MDGDLGPYAGAVSIATWNAQGLFAACPASRRAKRAQVLNLLRDHDVLIVTETHSTLEMELLTTREGQAYFDSYPAFWTHGTAARAGVGIIVRPAFLEQFSMRRGCRTIVPGRALELWLNGAAGDLSIFGVYFATGVDELDETTSA